MARRRKTNRVNKERPILAKLTRPALAGVYPRSRLFRRLDRGRSRPIVWISAPAGAGKTTLVASYVQSRRLPALWYQMDAGDNDIGSFFYYLGLATKAANPRDRSAMPLLTSEYATGLAAFTTNYFRNLFGRLKRGSAVVFDNFQDASGETIREVLQQGFDEIPPGVTVIVVSREEPPSKFARARASERIALIGWEDLRLTERENTILAKLRSKHRPSRTALHHIYRLTHGWVAGLVLLTERLDMVSAEQSLARIAEPSIFDYFANEIFDRISDRARAFLLKTAFLPKISIAVAQTLVGDSNSEAILHYLRQRNFFTVKHTDGTYEYHPLFRTFLLNRVGATYSADETRKLKRRSAEALAENGDAETAIALLQQTEDWQSCLGLVLKHARTLHAQGRGRTLESWLKGFPETILTNDPWALYWLGICRLPYSPAEARAHFERAFTLFASHDDASPLYLTWSRIIESFLYEMSDFTPMIQWLDRYRDLQGDRTPPNDRVEAGSVFACLAGLMNTKFDHPDVTRYAERAERLFEHETDSGRRLAEVVTLIPYYFWKGDLKKVGELLERLAPHSRAPGSGSLSLLYWYMFKSLYALNTGAADESFRATSDGLALAATSGIHVVDSQLLGHGIWSQLCVGNSARARSLLHQMSHLTETGQIKIQHYCHYASMVSLHEGDIAQAADQGKRALELAKAGGFFISVVSFLIGLAFAYVKQGETEAALTLLIDARAKASAMRSAYFLSYCALCDAAVRYVRGEQSRALRALTEALSLAKAGGFVTPAYCPRDIAAALYTLALENDICTDYVRAIISKTRLPPPRDILSERWPWDIRIYVFGRFSVMKDDAPLAFAGRAHQKPLELLRAIAAYGGRDVSMTLLANALWPDSDGDMAAHALRTALYRLRKLLGDECIETHDGRLRLNPNHCWLDTWAVESLFNEARDDALPPETRARHLLTFCRGPFLQGDEATWAMSARERVHATVLDAIAKLGRKLEIAGEEELAIACHQKGIEIEPLAEELYRNLMRIYQRLNRPSAALALYRRCKTTLASTLHMEPTPKTKALYEEIKRGASRDKQSS